MKIYTRTGDDGHTELFGGPRVPKDHPRPETCGTLDELSALVGLARAGTLPEEVDRLLGRVQHELFDVGAELASLEPVGQGTRTVGRQQIEALEAAIDRFDEPLPPLTGFILPGGTQAAAVLHLARAVCRRAERRLVGLARTSQPPISADLGAYLNRLGDLLFVLARTLSAQAGRADVPWQKGRT